MLTITATPSFSKSFLVRADKDGAKDGNNLGPASINLTFKFLATFAWSEVSGPRINSAMAPAISTPVGPPPITVMDNFVSSSYLHNSSNLRITSALIVKASATVFIPNAYSLTPGIPKSDVTDPRATIK